MNHNRHQVDRPIQGALENAFRTIDRSILEGYLTDQDVYRMLCDGWGDAVADAWAAYSGDE